MKKQAPYFIQCLLLFLSLICLPVFSLLGGSINIHYVQKGNSFATPPYTNIPTAADNVTVALTACVNSFDVIYILDSILDNDPFSADYQTNVSIIGTNTGMPPRFYQPAVANGIQISHCRNFRLQNVKVTNFRDSGILINNSTTCTLINVRCVKNGDYGLLVQRADNSLIKNSRFYQNGYLNGQGFGAVFNPSAGACTNNAFISNYVYWNSNRGFGLMGENVDNNLVAFNNIYRNSNDGLRVVDGDNNRILFNRIYSNGCADISAVDGIVFFAQAGGATNNLGHGNEVYRNKDNGITFWAASDIRNLFSSNIILDHASGVFLSSAASENIFTGNLISRNTDGFLTRFAANNVLISNNRITNNFSTGIRIDNPWAKRFRIVRNRLAGTGQTYGLYLSSAFSNEISNNDILDQRTAGIFLTNSSDNRLTANRIWSNNFTAGSAGILMIMSSRNRISGGIIYGNNRNIQVASNSSSCVITNADVFGAYYQGIYIRQSASNTIRNCRVYQNALGSGIIYSGITARGQQSRRNRIEHCLIRSNNTVGVEFLDSATNNYVLASTIAQNGRYGIKEADSLATGKNIIERNNITENLRCNFTNASSASVYSLTNNWWGSSLLSQVRSGIFQSGGSSAFIPYRLFGPFNIAPDADTLEPARVSGVTGSTNQNDVTLVWNRSAGAVRYFVYRTNVNAWSNFTRQKVKAGTVSTNWTDFDAPSGTQYYFITALDGAVLTNECWYSASNRILVPLPVPEPPVITNLSPVPNAFNVATNANIVFDILDTVSVLSQSILVKINGQTALTDGHSTLTASCFLKRTNTGPRNGYHVLVDRFSPFNEYQTVSLFIRGADNTSRTDIMNTVFICTDISPPSTVVLLKPVDGVVTNTNVITFIWQKAVDSGSGISNYRLRLTNSTVGWRTNIITLNTQILFGPLKYGSCSWRVRARDRADHRGSYSVPFDLDLVSERPVIIGMDPVSVPLQTNIPVASPVVIYFDRTMNPATTNSFRLRSALVTNIQGRFSFKTNSVRDDTMIFDPYLNLANQTYYTVSVRTNTARDQNGMALSRPTNYVFRTVPETNDITVIATFPQKDQTNVNAWVDIEILFNASMNTASTEAFKIMPPVSGQFRWGSQSFTNDTLFFAPLNHLSFSTVYYCTVSNNARSIYNNNLDRITNFKFVVEKDRYPPQNVSYLRASGGESVITLEWGNPSDADFRGTRIYYNVDTSYPSSTNDGIRLCDRSNAPGSLDSFLHENVEIGKIYYYTAFTYDRMQPPNVSVPNDNARAEATVGRSVEQFDIRPNLLKTGDSSSVELLFYLPEEQDIKVEIYNVAGERAAVLELGRHREYRYRWYGAIGSPGGTGKKKLAPGSYLAVFQNSGGQRKIRVFYVIR